MVALGRGTTPLGHPQDRPLSEVTSFAAAGMVSLHLPDRSVLSVRSSATAKLAPPVGIEPTSAGLEPAALPLS